MKSSILIAVFALPLLSACVIVDGEVATDFDNNHSVKYEKVYGADIGSSAITMRVASNGCTDKSFFEPHTRVRNGQHEVGFERIREDYCRAYFPEGKSFTWTYAEIGFPDDADVTLRNTIGRPDAD